MVGLPSSPRGLSAAFRPCRPAPCPPLGISPPRAPCPPEGWLWGSYSAAPPSHETGSLQPARPPGQVTGGWASLPGTVQIVALRAVPDGRPSGPSLIRPVLSPVLACCQETSRGKWPGHRFLHKDTTGRFPGLCSLGGSGQGGPPSLAPSGSRAWGPKETSAGDRWNQPSVPLSPHPLCVFFSVPSMPLPSSLPRFPRSHPFHPGDSVLGPLFHNPQCFSALGSQLRLAQGPFERGSGLDKVLRGPCVARPSLYFLSVS